MKRKHCDVWHAEDMADTTWVLTSVVRLSLAAGCSGHHYPPLDTEAMLEDAEVVKLVHRVAVFLGSAEAGDGWRI